jgi:hypothetical protein
LHALFERFAFDKFHRIKALHVLLAIMNHSRDIRMMNLRSRARFTEKSCPRGPIFRQLWTDNFERDNRF